MVTIKAKKVPTQKSDSYHKDFNIINNYNTTGLVKDPIKDNNKPWSIKKPKCDDFDVILSKYPV